MPEILAPLLAMIRAAAAGPFVDWVGMHSG